jgi:hypothetical protein
MDCDIDRILSYILCYSATIDMKEATDYRFTGLIKELQDVLPADRWGGGETQGRINAILSYTFQNRISHATIDVDLIERPTAAGESCTVPN